MTPRFRPQSVYDLPTAILRSNATVFSLFISTHATVLNEADEEDDIIAG